MSEAWLAPLGLVLATSVASGIRVYATIAVLGWMHRSGMIVLPGELGHLGQTWVIFLASALYLVEFTADKIPAVDSVWDAVHSFIRVPAAGLLAFGAMADVPVPWRIGASLLAGGAALSAHGLKSGTRLLINTSPEPFSNWGASLIEDLAVGVLLWFMVAHPILAALFAFAIVAAGVVFAFFAFRLVKRLFGGRPAQPAG